VLLFDEAALPFTWRPWRLAATTSCMHSVELQNSKQLFTWTRRGKIVPRAGLAQTVSFVVMLKKYDSCVLSSKSSHHCKETSEQGEKEGRKRDNPGSVPRWQGHEGCWFSQSRARRENEHEFATREDKNNAKNTDKKKRAPVTLFHWSAASMCKRLLRQSSKTWSPHQAP